ncbi:MULTISPECIES: epoxide hydrolase N-terminal domain-containing protein [unclassified Microbacterium]|uniref:epoxide hydrolase family protein n=1 Tax=unclassified Microbacterium TaxID=2609290 RepID=UPI00214BB3E0|nr:MULTISPECIES: epoxide hydrolase N-terminal domain-containing protein [unclassified Microbacterium]MCR2785504.1 epoxide hydrolase N-terminal domain-containing protein [Microbacterium sp. zg.B96]WIM17506.1 epoxide hydrolase N-terminal domain-containing protein [Microbacterium sp. zg-B96]
MTQPQAFSFRASDELLDDLRHRLATARLLPDSPRRPASGMAADYLAELVAAWRDFDWRSREQWLNSHPQFLVDIGDATVHFVHRRSARDDAPVLLVMHGWPHTFALQLDFTDLLPDFHVVVPSFPGFAFSPPYRDGPITERRLADTMHALMTEVLGYSRYLTYGEDVSANVNDLLAATRPKAVAGVLVTHAHFPSQHEREQLTDASETAFFAELAAAHGTDGAYGHVQATRPDTLAVALNDSPAGLLAWLTEKLVEWSDTSAGDPHAVELRISRERILTEAMIYWATQSIGTSFRPYYEGADQPEPMPPVTVPASVHIQRHEGDYPESLALRFYLDLRTFERLTEGGHFAVAEIPAIMADRVRAFSRSLGML